MEAVPAYVSVNSLGELPCGYLSSDRIRAIGCWSLCVEQGSFYTISVLNCRCPGLKRLSFAEAWSNVFGESVRPQSCPGAESEGRCIQRRSSTRPRRRQAFFGHCILKDATPGGQRVFNPSGVEYF